MRQQPELFVDSLAYERFMGRWSRRLAPLLVTFAGVEEGDVVLDVGTGTGVLASALAAIPSTRITGIDPSRKYVQYATGQAPTDRVQFIAGDAQVLQMSDASFDKTLSLLVLNFVPDSARAVAEMVRVTRPGGTVAAAVWDYGDGMEMLRVFWEEAAAMDPTAAAADERHMKLSHPNELTELWRAHGLQRVEEQALTIQTPFTSFVDYWEPFLGAQGPAGAYVASLLEPERRRLEAGLRRRLTGASTGDPFTLHARAWAVKGIVPHG